MHGHFRFHRYSCFGAQPDAMTVYAEPVSVGGVLYAASATADLHGTAVDWVEEQAAPFGSRLTPAQMLLSTSPYVADQVMDMTRSVAELVFRDLPGWHRVTDYRVPGRLSARMLSAQQEWAAARDNRAGVAARARTRRMIRKCAPLTQMRLVQCGPGS